MNASAYLHDIPKPIWIVAMVLGFIVFWPLGLAILAYTIGSRRWGRRHEAPGQWYNTQPQGKTCGWAKWGDFATPWNQPQRPEVRPSGNAAFDEYRAETIKRLEDEQREFVDYLERLRKAKDKAEFDQFMAERRRPMTPPEPPPAA